MFKRGKKLPCVDEISDIGEGLKELYKKKLLPLETTYNFHELVKPKLEDADFHREAMIMFLGQYSTGKTSFIKYLLGEEYPDSRIGPEPTTDRFVAIMRGDHNRSIPGNFVVCDQSKPFKALSKFGNEFLTRFSCSELQNDLLKGVTIIDTPGILSGEQQTLKRNYNFIEVAKCLGERCDRIYILFDAHKLDISDEFRQTIQALKPFQVKTRIILNKADQVDRQELMRVYGALMWSLGKITDTPEVARVFIGSFWEKPYHFDHYKDLFELEDNDLMEDLSQIPSSCTTWKCDNLITRARTALVHANIISTIQEMMPSFFNKAKKKAEIIDSLPELYKKLQTTLEISPGDFPPIEQYREKLQCFDFSKLSPLKSKVIEDAKSMLSIDIPALIQRIPNEESCQPDKNVLQGGIFNTLKKKEDFNPFQPNADSNIMLGADYSGWVVEHAKSRYDEVFESLGPIDGKLIGRVAKEYLVKSKLPNSVLSRIWQLSDIDKDGCLDEDEFALCSYLIDVKLKNAELPSKITKQLAPPSKHYLLEF